MREFIKDLSNSILWKILNIIFSLLTGILLARLLGPEDRGIYALIILNITFLSLIINFGTTESIIFFIGKNKHNISKNFSSIFLFTLFLSFVPIIFFSISGDKFNFLFYGVDKAVIIYATLSIIPLTINTQIRHYFLGLKMINNYNILVFTEVFIGLLNLIVLFYFNIFSLTNVVICFFLMHLISSLFHFYFFNFKHLSLYKFSFHHLIDNLKLGAKYFLIGQSGFWQNRLLLLFIASFLGNKSVGLFTVAMSFSNFLLQIPNQISLILYPYISNFKNENDSNELTYKTVSLTFIFISIISFFIIILMKPIINILYGYDYLEMYQVARILIISSLFSSVSSILLNYFGGIGKPNYNLIYSICNILILIIFSIFLIKYFDLIGASITRFISIFIPFIVLIYFAKNNLKIKKTSFLLFNSIDDFKKIINK